MKIAIAMAVGVSGLFWGANGASADGVKCDKASKKLKWHMCVQKDVKYKRGLKTESRNECAIIKPIPAKGGCDLGDLFRHIPTDVEYYSSVIFYAIGPKGMDTSSFEIQRDAEESMCGVGEISIDSYKLMKFSDAFDKSNRQRGEMVEAKLAKKKKQIMREAIFVKQSPYGSCKGKKALLGAIDKKSQSKFLFYAESAISR